MKTIFKKIAAGLVLSSALLPAQAQEFRTSYFMQTSNFRHQMNPALIDAPTSLSPSWATSTLVQRVTWVTKTSSTSLKATRSTTRPPS